MIHLWGGDRSSGGRLIREERVSYGMAKHISHHILDMVVDFSLFKQVNQVQLNKQQPMDEK